MTIKHASPVTVSLNDLTSGTIPFSSLLEAFGPESLGILVVKDLPVNFLSLRERVLSNSSKLAALPAETLKSLTNARAKYLVGWSHGAETLRPGVVDTAKGSYYINCAFYQSPELQGADGVKFPGFEEYTAPNIWPSDEDVRGFKTDAEALIALIIDTAVLVARACDKYAEKSIPEYTSGYLERVVRTSETSKARLLHYFPTDQPSQTGDGTNGTNGIVQRGGEEVDDSWCATHLDHGCLTGLTSAMFLDEASTSPLTEIPSPDPTSGLYIKSRSGEVVKVGIPRDCLAFQTGEALELITQGRFRAVPHFVRGVDAGSLKTQGKEDMRVARNTLAVFTQPNLDELVEMKEGTTFGEFARGVVRRNTKD